MIHEEESKGTKDDAPQPVAVAGKDQAEPPKEPISPNPETSKAKWQKVRVAWRSLSAGEKSTAVLGLMGAVLGALSLGILDRQTGTKVDITDPNVTLGWDVLPCREGSCYDEDCPDYHERIKVLDR